MTSHDLGLWLLSSCFTVAAISILQLVQSTATISHSIEPVIVLRAVNVIAVIALGFSSLFIPRRPDVYFGDRIVDAQFSVSAFNRYTWGWVRPILDKASKTNDLNAQDVPDPDHRVRTEKLKRDWEKHNFKGSLLRSLVWVYRRQIILQWSLTLFRCFISVMPYWTMLRLLKILETRGTEGTATLELWSLVIWLGIFTLADNVRILSLRFKKPNLNMCAVDRRMGVLVFLRRHGHAHASSIVCPCFCEISATQECQGSGKGEGNQGARG